MLTFSQLILLNAVLVSAGVKQQPGENFCRGGRMKLRSHVILGSWTQKFRKTFEDLWVWPEEGGRQEGGENALDAVWFCESTSGS